MLRLFRTVKMQVETTSGRGQLLEEGRQVINTERQRLDLSPLQSGLLVSL